MQEHGWTLLDRQGMIGPGAKCRSSWGRRVMVVLVCLVMGGIGGTAGVTTAGDAPADQVAAVHQAKVIPADGAAENNFGNCVAVSGDTMVVGAWRDDDLGDSSGSAYVFVRNGGVWVQQQKLTAPAPEGAPGDSFGVSVAVDGNTVVVGADHATVGGNRTGAAYVFVRSGGAWLFQQRLTAGDAALGDLFGRSVAISGNTVVVGAPGEGAAAGAAYIFVRDGTVWTQQKKLMADDRAANDMFGGAVAISGDTVAVGADVDNGAFPDSGSVYVFVRGGGLWTQQQHLTAPDAALGDNFGGSVALSGDTLVVGAASDDDVVHGTSSGSAYAFVRTAGVWAPPAKLTAADAADYHRFGSSVALNGDTVVVGADGDGSAYMFVHGGGAWAQQAKLTPADGGSVGAFGSSLSISGNTLVIGAYQDSVLGYGSGSAYVFLVNAPPLADAGPDQTVLPGDRVKLSALNSRDRDDGIASYQWRQVSGKRVTLSNPGANQLNFIAPQVGAKGTSLGFELKVTDRSGLQTTDRCLVTVTTDNRAPLAKAGPAQRVAGGTAVTLNGSRSRDPHGTTLKYSWKQISGPAVALSGRSTPQATFTAPTVGWGGGCLRFRLTVTDAKGLKAEDTTLVNVCAGNLPPKARAGKKQTVGGNTRVRLDGSTSTDPDDVIASYRWEQLSGPPVKLSNPLAIKPAFRSPKVSQGGVTLMFQLTVTDQGGLQSQSRCQVQVRASP
jgi:hypothetical protein